MIDSETLEKLEQVGQEMPTYYLVYCETACEFAASAWLEEEARLRGQIHGHDCLVEQQVVVDQDLPELGL